MKRVIVASDFINVNKVVRIVVADEIGVSVYDEVYAANSSTDDDNRYAYYTDEQLRAISDDEIRNIEDVETLVRLNKLCSERLTTDQRSYLSDVMNTRLPITDAEVSNIIAQLHSCTKIVYRYGEHDKTDDFLNDHEMDIEDCLDIIHSIEQKDVQEKYRSADPKYSGDVLLTFLLKHVKLPDGYQLNKLKLYVKINVSLSTGNATAVISFHPEDNDKHSKNKPKH